LAVPSRVTIAAGGLRRLTADLFGTL